MDKTNLTYQADEITLVRADRWNNPAAEALWTERVLLCWIISNDDDIWRLNENNFCYMMVAIHLQIAVIEIISRISSTEKKCA